MAAIHIAIAAGCIARHTPYYCIARHAVRAASNAILLYRISKKQLYRTSYCCIEYRRNKACSHEHAMASKHARPLRPIDIYQVHTAVEAILILRKTRVTRYRIKKNKLAGRQNGTGPLLCHGWQNPTIRQFKMPRVSRMKWPSAPQRVHMIQYSCDGKKRVHYFVRGGRGVCAHVMMAVVVRP